MRYKYLVLLASLSTESLAQTSSDLQTCRAITDSLQRLACFDRVVPSRNPTNSNEQVLTMTAVDFMADARELKDKIVKVSGYGIALADLLFLYPKAGQSAGFPVNLTSLDRESRRQVIGGCGSGCEIEVVGKATYQPGLFGITARSISLK